MLVKQTSEHNVVASTHSNSIFTFVLFSEKRRPKVMDLVSHFAKWIMYSSLGCSVNKGNKF